MTGPRPTLTVGPVYQHLLALTVPMIWGVLALMSFNLADTWFVAQLGELELARKKGRVAASYFESALRSYREYDPGKTHWKPHYYLGLIAFRTDRLAEAQGQLEAASARYPYHPAPLFLLGRTHEKAGNTQVALETFQQVLEIAPADSPLRRQANRRIRKIRG